MFFILENTKLIILGNGFDLACGLKSKYEDFFKKRISQELDTFLKRTYQSFEDRFSFVNNNGQTFRFQTIYEVRSNYLKNKGDKNAFDMMIFHLGQSDMEILKNSNLTFWDIVLYYFQTNTVDRVDDIDWRAVEDRIFNFLNDTNIDKPCLTAMLNTIKHFEDLDMKNWFCLYLAKILSDGKKIPDDFIRYLYQELRSFESAFIDFLNEEVNSNDDYEKKARDLLLKIVSANDMSVLFEQKYLSFNYTEPIVDPNINMTNVHGTLKSKNIIFGIDQTEVDPSCYIYRFTKTFRQMTETSISKRSEELILPKKEEINEIAFFGHSLSPLDYSYFQTIFDFYDLYNSDINLAFYYKLYGDVTNLDMELDLSKKISEMLKSYSPSIGNKNKANNLMHKLLLEKRLIIEEVSL